MYVRALLSFNVTSKTCMPIRSPCRNLSMFFSFPNVNSCRDFSSRHAALRRDISLSYCDSFYRG